MNRHGTESNASEMKRIGETKWMKWNELERNRMGQLFLKWNEIQRRKSKNDKENTGISTSELL